MTSVTVPNPFRRSQESMKKKRTSAKIKLRIQVYVHQVCESRPQAFRYLHGDKALHPVTVLRGRGNHDHVGSNNVDNGITLKMMQLAEHEGNYVADEIMLNITSLTE